MILAPKYPVFIQMAPGTSSTAALFTLPHHTSRSGQIIEPQLNRGSIHSPDQGSFVWIYLKKSRLYHLSNLLSVIARVLPKQSPGNTQPSISRIPPPRTKRHHLFKTLSWSSSIQNGVVPRIFFESTRYHLSHFSHLGTTWNLEPGTCIRHSLFTFHSSPDLRPLTIQTI